VSDVRVGQVWRDRDKREKERGDLRVTATDPWFAYVENLKTGKCSRIKRERLLSTRRRYDLVEDA
jgi:hypothetical protein